MIGRGNKSTRVDANALTATTTWTTNPTAGQKVIVWVWGSFTAAPTVKDNGTTQTTFTLASSKIDSGNGDGCWIFYGDGITLPATGSYHVVVTFSGSANSFSCGGVAYSNVATGAPTATNSAAGNSMSYSTGAVINASNALYAGAYVSNANSIDTITPGGGFTDEFNLDDGSNFDQGAGSDLINATGSQTATWANGTVSRAWAACIATWPEVAAAVYERLPSTITINQAVNRAGSF